MHNQNDLPATLFEMWDMPKDSRDPKPGVGQFLSDHNASHHIVVGSRSEAMFRSYEEFTAVFRFGGCTFKEKIKQKLL